MRTWITVDTVTEDGTTGPDLGTAKTKGMVVGRTDGSECLCLVSLLDEEEVNLPEGRTDHGYEVESNGKRASIPSDLSATLITEAQRLGADSSWNPKGFNV